MLCCLLMVIAVGCDGREAGTEIILTTDFVDGEVFRIEKSSCMLPEILVYLLTAKDQYENVFGAEIWQKDLEGLTLEEQVKDTTLSRIAQIKAMNLLAEKYNVKLDGEEQRNVEKAAETFYDSLSEKEITAIGADVPLIRQLYTEFAVANKLYNFITGDINPEISDDEARTITVKHILIKTYSLNEDGSKLEYSEEKKEDALRRAETVLRELEAGADFDEMAELYNEDTDVEYSFGQGTMPVAFEEAAFNLDTEQISEVVETEYGYHIIKCTSTFNREETDANKIKIVEKRKSEAFDQVYSQFLDTLTSKLNEGLWESVSLSEFDGMDTTNFFDVYNEYFAVAEE